MPLWIDMLTAPTFRFVIGKERKVFNVPENIFEHVSIPLHMMATSQNFVEARAGEAVIEDCEPEVFAAVCEFAYTATFDDPNNTDKLRELKGAKELVSWRCGRPHSSDDPSQQHRISAFDWQNFDAYGKLDFDQPRSLFKEYKKIFGMRGEDIARTTGFYFNEEDLYFSEVYIPAHASLCCKVYVFAQKYLAKKLQVLAMQRLQLGFQDDLPYPEELLESLEHAFAKTERSEINNDPLRELLVGYAFSQAKKLYTMAEFHEILAKYPELAIDMGNALVPFLPGST